MTNRVAWRWPRRCAGPSVMVEVWVWVLGYLGLGTQISGGAPPDPRYLGWVITLPAFLLFHRIHPKSYIFDIFAAALCAAHCTVNTVHQVSGYPKPKYPDVWGGYPEPRYLGGSPPEPRTQPWILSTHTNLANNLVLASTNRMLGFPFGGEIGRAHV